MVGQPYVRNAGDADVLKVAAIQFFDRSPEVGSRLELNEAKTGSALFILGRLRGGPTLRCYRCGLSRSRQRQGRTGGRSLSDPRARVHVS